MQLIYLALGIIPILNGILLIIQPKYYSSKFHKYFDFTGIEWPFGSIQIIMGLLFACSVLRKKHGLKNKTMMCPECVKPFNLESVKNAMCPVCGFDLEELNGFYDRHPELKEDKT